MKVKKLPTKKAKTVPCSYRLSASVVEYIEYLKKASKSKSHEDLTATEIVEWILRDHAEANGYPLTPRD